LDHLQQLDNLEHSAHLYGQFTTFELLTIFGQFTTFELVTPFGLIPTLTIPKSTISILVLHWLGTGPSM
jgi:hypothetical protein